MTDNGVIIAWEDPAPAEDRDYSAAYRALAAVLTARPHTWGLVDTAPDTAGRKRLDCRAHAIRTGKIRALADAGQFDATTRKRPGGDYGLFVRFTGEGA